MSQRNPAPKAPGARRPELHRPDGVADGAFYELPAEEQVVHVTNPGLVLGPPPATEPADLPRPAA